MTTEAAQRLPKARRSWWRWPLRVAVSLLLALTGWVLGNASRMLFVETEAPELSGNGRGRWVRAHDVQLHLTEQGAVDGPLLVLVAGTGAWGGTWAGNFEALRTAGWRVVTIDLPPFGFSSRPGDGDYSRHAQAQRLLGAIHSLGPPSGNGPVVLLGHSYGGGPAAEAAMLEPALVRHLILVDAAIGLRPRADSPCHIDTLMPSLLAWRPLRSLVVANTATQPMFTPWLLEQFVARKEAVTPERVAIYSAPFKVQGTSAAIGDWAYQFATSCEAPRSQSNEGFAALRAPLTLLWGELDTITPLQQARDIAAAAPGSQLVVLPGVGHIPQIENPQLFDRRLAEVLNRLR